MERLNILVAGENDAVRGNIVECLSQRADVEFIEQAKGGIDAIVFTHQYNPNVILLDIDLSASDGIEVARYIKAFYPDTKIVLITPQQNYPQTHLKPGSAVDGFVNKTNLMLEIPTVLERLKQDLPS